MEKYVIYSEIDGIYLGSAMGMGFWSKLDPAGQEEAVAFDSTEDAWEFVASWECAPQKDTKVVPVQVESEQDFYASMKQIAEAGLPIWNPNEHETMQ